MIPRLLRTIFLLAVVGAPLRAQDREPPTSLQFRHAIVAGGLAWPRLPWARLVP